MKQTASSRCFLTQEKTTTLASLTHVHPIAKISKVKDIALILLINVFTSKVFIFCQKAS